MIHVSFWCFFTPRRALNDLFYFFILFFFVAFKKYFKIIIIIVIIIIHLYSAFSTRFKGAVYKKLDKTKK